MVLIVPVLSILLATTSDIPAKVEADAQDASQQIVLAFKKVGQTFKALGQDVGHGAKEAGLTVGHAAKEGGQAVGHGAKEAGKSVGKGATTFGHGVKDGVKTVRKRLKKPLPPRESRPEGN